MTTVAHKANRFGLGIAKLCLNLAILGALVSLGWFAYDVATHGTTTQHDAIGSALIIIGGITGVVLLIRLASRGVLGQAQPGFGLTILGVVGVFLVLGFTGVEPMRHYLGQAGQVIDPWIGWAKLGWELSFLAAMISPIYLLVFIAIAVWIIYMVRRW